ncbi:MAG TPA: hypothetical protein VH814_19485 [Steroidobacteraceae bacterium]|jgi:hypothetical protein
MKVRILCIAIGLLTLGCGAAEACVCDRPGSIGTADWLRGTGAASAHIFLARITEVVKTNKNPDLEQRAKVEIVERFKGDAQFESLSITPCQNFALKEGDVRVFFVSRTGIILPCSDYRPFIGDEELLQKLRTHRAR